MEEAKRGEIIQESNLTTENNEDKMSEKQMVVLMEKLGLFEK